MEENEQHCDGWQQITEGAIDGSDYRRCHKRGGNVVTVGELQNARLLGEHSATCGWIGFPRLSPGLEVSAAHRAFPFSVCVIVGGYFLPGTGVVWVWARLSF